MDKRKCEEMIKKSERLERERDECLKEGDLNGAIKAFKKIVNLDNEMLEKCNKECAYEVESC